MPLAAAAAAAAAAACAVLRRAAAAADRFPLLPPCICMTRAKLMPPLFWPLLVVRRTMVLRGMLLAFGVVVVLLLWAAVN